jgi:UDP:flavonoid glycosyltransferase YjiC (YdhE family)
MKKKILFISETVTMAHLIRPLKVASSLSLNDYEIHFAATKVPDFLRNEFENYTLHEINNGVSEKDFLDAIAQGKHPYTDEILKMYIEEDLRLLNTIKPDLVIGDMRLTLHVSAKLENIPYINISNSTWDSSAILPNLVPELPVVKFFGVTISQMVFPLIRESILAKLALPFNNLAKNFGIKEYGSYYDVLTSGDYTIYGDLKSLVNFSEIKSSKVNVGALVYSMNLKGIDVLELPKKNKPRVVLTLGSSGPSHHLQEMINTLAELDIELVVSTSGKNVKAPVKENVILAEYLQFDKVLAEADLLIFNGGSGTGYLGLSHGVPLLCIPSNIDQHQFSCAIAQRGAANIIRSDKISMRKLKSLVEQMLSDSKAKIAAELIANEMTKENPLAEITQLIETILEPKLIKETVIESIITAAIQSPSGDNCQPWQFQWNGESLLISYDELRGAHSLNRSNHASLLAFGGLLESIKISASQFGLLTSIQMLVKNTESKLPWAKVQFSNSSQNIDPLAFKLFQRCTDRRPYKGGSITDSVFADIKVMANGFKKARIHVDGSLSKKIISYFMDSENFLWTNKKIVQDLVKWMRLSRKEFTQSSDGMSWKNMYINVIDALFLRVLRTYPKSLKFFWNFGLKQKIRMMTKKSLKSSAGLFCITIKKMDAESLCEAGQLAFRAWVMLNAKNYGVQPLTFASTSIAEALSNSLPAATSLKEKDHFLNGFEIVSQSFNLEKEDLPVWIFRTGITDSMPRQNRTNRLKVDEVLLRYRRKNSHQNKDFILNSESGLPVNVSQDGIRS